MIRSKHYYSQDRRGVAILFAILLVSIVLTVGLSLVNITVRQLTLSSLARESQFAFYAADSARGCARYYDSLDDPAERPFGYFDISSGLLEFINPTDNEVRCANDIVALSDGVNFTETETGGSGIRYGFVLKFDVDEGKTTCAEVFVYKYTNPPDLLGKTKIVSRGYNNYNGGTGSSCYLDTDRTVERASTMIY